MSKQDFGPSFLSEFYLNTLDSKVTSILESLVVGNLVVPRFVDDILLRAPEEHLAEKVKDFIIRAAPASVFTSVSAVYVMVQLLDLELQALYYKPVFSRRSAHSKLVKLRVVKSTIGHGIKKARIPCVKIALGRQLERLTPTGRGS